ncbi:MAG TPA: NAD(P)H-binding protein [Longimicrobiales bacterium]
MAPRQAAPTHRNPVDRRHSTIPIQSSNAVPVERSHPIVQPVHPLLRDLRDRVPYRATDLAGNANLLKAARAEGVGRFVYVSVYSTPAISRTAYVEAHEAFAERLARSGLAYAVVRPTGFFYVFLEYLAMARKGRGLVIGSGEARTNPIHERDVAELCVEALDAEPGTVIDAGGPDVLTRRRTVELAFEALGRGPRVTTVPAAVFGAAAATARPLNPRLAELLRFVTAASTNDVVAPPRGRRDLRSYLEQAAGPGSPT